MTEVKIFLASSSELLDERRALEIFLARKSDLWEKERGIKLDLIIWEKLLDNVSATRKQDDYNQYVKPCDVFLTLCWRKTGAYTEEEFDNAYEQFLENSKSKNYLKKATPSIHVYFKKISDQDSAQKSLTTFKEKVNALGHFETYFGTINDLCNQFGTQLDLLYANKSIKSSVWIGIIALTLAVTLGIYYYVTIPGKSIDLKEQRYIIGGLLLFSVSVGALLFGIMAIVRDVTKRYFISERILALTGTIITVLVGWFTIVPPVTIFHISGRVLDPLQKAIPGVELNVEGTEMLIFSDSEGKYTFTFPGYSVDSLLTVVTSHAKYEDLSLNVRFDSPEIHKDLILTPVHH